jgi:hypothetical protein
MTRERLLNILREFKRDCAEKYGILEIGVFALAHQGADPRLLPDHLDRPIPPPVISPAVNSAQFERL